MKEGWEYKSLGDVCEILDSRRKPITKNKRESGTIPYYGATGILDYVKDYIFDEKLVLLGEDGAKWGAGENSAYIVEGKTWVNNHAHALRPKREHLIDELLVYYLNFANLQPFITGVTVPKLNQEKMRSIEIPVPPLSEQQSIVDYLDSAFAKIDAMKANAEKALNEAKALFQASLKEMLEPKEGWEKKKFGDVCWYNKNNGIHKGTKYVGMEHIEQGTGTLIGTISSDDVLSNTFAFNKGDVLYGRLRPYLKKVIVADFDGCCSTEIFPIRSKSIIASFLKYWFLTDEITNKVDATCAGCRMPRGNMNDVLKFDISYPPHSEQQSIVATLDSLKSKVDRLQANYDKISQECDALKQAILRQVFE
jgi:type I restriction enzyme S subunit